MKKCVRCQGVFAGDDWRCSHCGYAPAVIDGIPCFAPEMASGNDGFKAEFFGQMFDLEAGNFWFRARSKLIHYLMEKHFPDASSFLEIGCGTGYVLSQIEKHFPKLTLTGGEAFSAGLKLAATRMQKVSLLQMDARNLPFREDFDLIGAFDVIEHIAEDEQVLQQMHAATRAGGGLIVTVPQHAWLWSHADDYAQHKRRYSAAELATKVRAAGYEVVAMTSFVSLLLPAMYLSRLMNREARPDYDDTAELRLNRGVNFLFERVMDLERGLIKMGISFGAGGSLILVARKPD